MNKRLGSSSKVSNVKRYKSKIKNYIFELNYLGLVFATVSFALSVTPSLLPRTSFIQGLVTGLATVIGYGIGVMVSASIRWFTEYEIPTKFKSYAWKFLIAGGVFTFLLFSWLAKKWHDEVQNLVGLPPEQDFRMLVVIVVAIVVAVLVLAVSRAIRRIANYVNKQIDRRLPRRVSIALSVLIVGVLLIWIVSGLFVESFVNVSNAYFGARDTTVPEGYSQPQSSLRSGSPNSLSSWETIGYQGRKFVASGPDEQKIKQVTGEADAEPIRVYVGLKAADTAEQRAELVVKEMERTGAFKRPVLILANTTGSGWLQPSAVDSIEYIFGGNTAIVTQQYSYLPSWISYLVDKEAATETGQALFDAVYGKWIQMSKESRPKLYAYGLSLGSYSGQTPYSGVNDFRFAIDGALFVGTPNFANLWRNITNNRDFGSPEWLPKYRNGQTVRFAYNNDTITSEQKNWEYPRLLYLQHASDPVVWFDFSLIDTKPDWLNETRGPDVSPATRWFPIVTFLQLGVDQISAGNVPVGHGHMYGNAVVNSWVSVTNPSNWDQSKTKKLQDYINANY